MNTFKHTALAMAFAALLASPLAWAADDTGGSGSTDISGSFDKTATKTFDETDTIEYDNKVKTHIVKKLDVDKDVQIEGKVDVSGAIDVDSSAIATVDEKQVNINNEGKNVGLPNTATGTVTGNTGNVGANTAAGNYNQQGNDASLAATSSTYTKSQSDAESFVFQDSEFNKTNNEWTTNTATGTVSGNTGNTGANVAAGDGIQQKNVLVAAVSNGTLVEATSYKKQQIDSNFVDNHPFAKEKTDSFGDVSTELHPTTNTASLTVDGNVGNVGANVAAGAYNQQGNTLALSVSTGTTTSIGSGIR